MGDLTRRRVLKVTAAGALAAVTGLPGCGDDGDDGDGGASSAVPSTDAGAGLDVFLVEAHNSMQPKEVINAVRALRRERKLAFSEHMDLGSAYFLELDWSSAQEAFDNAAGAADRGEEKAVALLASAQAAAAKTDFVEAGQLANQAQRHIEQDHEVSHQIAAARFAFWTSAGNTAERRSAEQMIARLDINTQGEEVCAGGAIVVAMIVGSVITYTAYKEGILTREEAREVITSIVTMGLKGRAIR